MKVLLGNDCGTTGSDGCFDCHQCLSGTSSPSETAFVLVKEDGAREYTSVTGLEAEALIEAFGLKPKFV